MVRPEQCPRSPLSGQTTLDDLNNLRQRSNRLAGGQSFDSNSQHSVNRQTKSAINRSGQSFDLDRRDRGKPQVSCQASSASGPTGTETG